MFRITPSPAGVTVGTLASRTTRLSDEWWGTFFCSCLSVATAFSHCVRAVACLVYVVVSSLFFPAAPTLTSTLRTLRFSDGDQCRLSCQPMSATRLTLDDLPVIDFELFLARGQGWEGMVLPFSLCVCCVGARAALSLSFSFSVDFPS